MTAREVVQGLSTVVDAFLASGGTVPRQGGSAVDVAGVVTSAAFADFRAAAADFAARVQPDDLPGVIDELTRRRETLRGSRAVHELTSGELAAYSALGDLRQLMTAEHLRIAMHRASLEDFARTVVPIVQALAPIALALL